MTLMQRAMMLGKLAELMKSLALTQEQFKSIKGLILIDDPRMTLELFTMMAAFRDQRAAGILTDSEYNSLIIQSLQGVSSDCASSAADAAENTSPAVQQPSKRKRYDYGGRSLPKGGQREIDPGNSSISGSRNDNDTERTPALTRSRHQQRTETREVPSRQEGSQWRVNIEKPKPTSVDIAHGKPRQGHSDNSPPSGSGDSGNGSGTGSSATSDLMCFRWQRWTKTLRFSVPFNGYCEYDVPLSFVDSTVELLEKAQQRRFPAHRGGPRQLAKESKTSFKNQRDMYCKYKKVMVCGEDEQLVYTATDEEVAKVVKEVADGRLTIAEYLRGVKELRAAQSKD